jgi:hypothetical protein
MSAVPARRCAEASFAVDVAGGPRPVPPVLPDDMDDEPRFRKAQILAPLSGKPRRKRSENGSLNGR